MCMELRHNNADCMKEEKRDKKELSKFKKLMEKGKELLGKTAYCVLVGATVTFMACGSSKKMQGDSDNDTTEEVTDTYDEPDSPDVIPDTIDDSPDIIEDGADTEDVEEEELPPLECPSPVENTPPDLNTTFHDNLENSGPTTDGRITTDYDLHLSMNPDVTYDECLTADEGGYELVCTGDSVNVEGQEYLVAGGTSFDVNLEPASSITDMCPETTTEYPILAGASETVMNVTYDFGGGVTVDSIAGFTISDLTGFYFDVNGTRSDVTTLAFTASSAGEHVIQFKRDAETMTFNSRSLDGRGNESTDSHNIMVNPGSSKPFYFIAFDPEDRANYDVIVSSMYTGNTICARCSGGPTHYEVTIPLTLNPPIDNACGQLGFPSNIRADVTSSHVSPPHLASTMTIDLSTNVSTINSPLDNPSLVFSVDYSGPSDMDAMSMSITANIVVEGVSHACSGGTLLTASYPTTVYAEDPDGTFYLADCSCTFGG